MLIGLYGDPMDERKQPLLRQYGPWLLLSYSAVAHGQALDSWSAGAYRCAVEHAVGIHVHKGGITEGPVTPDPASFTLRISPLDADCGPIGVAHTTVGIALRCTAGSSTADLDDELGGTLYQWAFPGPTFINVQGTTMLQLGRGSDANFMWSFVLPDYSSVYYGTCKRAG